MVSRNVGPELIDDVLARLKELPPALCRSAVQKRLSVTMISVEPGRPECCGFALEVANDRQPTYGFYADPCLAFDDLFVSEVSPMTLVEAVLSGQVRVERWTVIGLGLVAKTRGEIILENGASLYSTRTDIPCPERLCRQDQFQFAPYLDSECASSAVFRQV